MYLKYLEFTNFRNYSKQMIKPDLFYNILTGQNAQGKTNILEAIYLSCTGKSFRTAREKEIIQWESDFSYINCLFETDRRQIEVKIILKPGQKKIEVNGVIARGYPLGWPGVVLFTPEDLILVKGSPQERRRFLDLEIGPFHHQYGHYLGRYNRVLSQRNNLLREIREKRLKNNSLQPWNEQFCRYGAKLLFLRMDLLKRLIPSMRSIHLELTGGVEDLDIRYLSSLKMDNMTNEEEIYLRFSEEIKNFKEEEIARAQSLIGPHRDDLSFFINGYDAKIYGSQGQQRTIVLTLKISQIQQWHNELNEYPILLLDDVLFELDKGRQKALFNRVRGMVQTFITSTGAENFDIEDEVSKTQYTVSMGKIINK